MSTGVKKTIIIFIMFFFTYTNEIKILYSKHKNSSFLKLFVCISVNFIIFAKKGNVVEDKNKINKI